MLQSKLVTPYIPQLWESPSFHVGLPYATMRQFVGKRVVVLEIKSGITTHLYGDGMLANRVYYRNLQTCNVSAQMFWGKRHFLIPPSGWVTANNLEYSCGVRYCAEYPYLEGLFLWDGPYCLSWKETQDRFRAIGLLPPVVMYEGEFYEPFLWNDIYRKVTRSKTVGYVIRNTEEISMCDFYRNMAQIRKPYRRGKSEEYYIQNPVLNRGAFPEEMEIDAQDCNQYHDSVSRLATLPPDDFEARRKSEKELNRLEKKYGLWNCLRMIGK